MAEEEKSKLGGCVEGFFKILMVLGIFFYIYEYYERQNFKDDMLGKLVKSEKDANNFFKERRTQEEFRKDKEIYYTKLKEIICNKNHNVLIRKRAFSVFLDNRSYYLTKEDIDFFFAVSEDTTDPLRDVIISIIQADPKRFQK